MYENPAHRYRAVAREIVERVKKYVAESLDRGANYSDSYWTLEQGIVDAMRMAHQEGADRTRIEMTALMNEFDKFDGTSSS